MLEEEEDELEVRGRLEEEVASKDDDDSDITTGLRDHDKRRRVPKGGDELESYPTQSRGKVRAARARTKVTFVPIPLSTSDFVARTAAKTIQKSKGGLPIEGGNSFFGTFENAALTL